MTPPEGLFTALRAGFPADLDAVAIECADTPQPLRYTWRDLERGTAMLARLFESLALPPGSRIAVHTDKSVEALMLYLAVLRAGHVHLPLNVAYQAAELHYFVADAAPAVVVCTSANFGWVSKIAFQAGTRHVFTLDDDRSGTLLDRAAFQPDSHEPAPCRSGDLAAIVYTSGTTGRSKGAMLTHGNLLSNARVLKEHWAWNPADVLIHALPIFHVHGLFVAVHGALLAGCRMIWFNRFDAHAVVSRLPEATVFMGVPTLYVRMLGEHSLTPEACGLMRLFVSGSAPLLIDTFRRWQERTGHTILERYGMSETVMLTSNPYRPESARRGGTVGLPLPGVGLRVHDAKGRPLAAGEIGGIEVKGPNVFKGYWRMPEKTADEFTTDLWFKTGDVGQLDADGYLTIVGRSKDLIISGGYNVYPAEIEDYVNEVPGVAETAVVGVPHPDFGEAVIAVVVRKPGAELDGAAMTARLKATIAHFKVPKRIFVCDELPRNAMGKVQKNLLREQHRELFPQVKLLVLGGTRFLGRHLVEQALAAGHAVTLLHRGRSAAGLFAQAEHRIADRDGDLAAALAGGRWDAVVDTSACVPRQVHAAAAAALAGRVGLYLLVSTISVYADFDTAGADEDAPLQTLADPATETVNGATYGGLKALCEAAARQRFGDACLVARPGLLVGPHDPTGRYTWWVQRLLRGAAGGTVLAPGDPAAPVQCIDARDAAAWLLRQAELGTRGTYNLNGPAAPTTMGALLEAMRQALAPAAAFEWVDEDFLLAASVAPWSDLPLWLPRAQSAMHQLSIARALATGLQCRTPAQTAADTAAWAAGAPQSPVAGPLRPPVGLAPEREAALLQAWRATRA